MIDILLVSWSSVTYKVRLKDAILANGFQTFQAVDVFAISHLEGELVNLLTQWAYEAFV
jgi:hypothetical protein